MNYYITHVSLFVNGDVESTVHVGFEILIPSVLRQLESHGVLFSFAGRKQLLDLYERKIARFRPETLYTKHSATLFRSLQAFVGVIDFGKVHRH